MRERIRRNKSDRSQPRIERFGFANPVLFSNESEIIAGHGRVQAAKLLNLLSGRLSRCRI
jgi:hypothetical protein